VWLCCFLFSMWWIFILCRSLWVCFFVLSVVGVQWFDSVYPAVVCCTPILVLCLGLWVETSGTSFYEFLLRCVWEDVSVRKCNVARWRPVTRDGP